MCGKCVGRAWGCLGVCGKTGGKSLGTAWVQCANSVGTASRQRWISVGAGWVGFENSVNTAWELRGSRARTAFGQH
eukprot:1319930-Rhodomonas_salina.1